MGYRDFDPTPSVNGQGEVTNRDSIRATFFGDKWLDQDKRDYIFMGCKSADWRVSTRAPSPDTYPNHTSTWLLSDHARVLATIGVPRYGSGETCANRE